MQEAASLLSARFYSQQAFACILSDTEHQIVNEPVDRVEQKDQMNVESTSPEQPPTVEVDETSGDTSEEKVTVEEYKISGNDLVAKVKELIHQGNIRRIIIKNEEGRTLVEIPMTVGVVGGVLGAAMFPVVAAVGAIGALVAHLTVAIERKV